MRRGSKNVGIDYSCQRRFRGRPPMTRQEKIWYSGGDQRILSMHEAKAIIAKHVMKQFEADRVRTQQAAITELEAA